jgi:hypothetical protein
MRRVLVEELRSKRVEAPPPRWISDSGARNRLGELMLPARDRFLIDLLSTSGIRVGEALSLFEAATLTIGPPTQTSFEEFCTTPRTPRRDTKLPARCHAVPQRRGNRYR